MENESKCISEKQKRFQFYFTHLLQTKIDLEYEYDKQKNLIHETDKVIKYIEVDLRVVSQNYKNKNDAQRALKVSKT